jgi:hypothetical protein
MPYELDTEALDSPNMKVLDINKPPTKQAPHREFPKMLFMHPRDKSKEHLVKIAADEDEAVALEAKGWRTNPHVPVPAPEDLNKDYEAEVPEIRRGPGRPAKVV